MSRLCFLLPSVVFTAKDDENLLFGYMTWTALGIAIGGITIIIIATVVACYFDHKGRSGLPKSCREYPPAIWSPREVKIAKAVQLHLTTEKSAEEESSTALGIDEIFREADMTQRSRVEMPSSRIDQSIKHNLIIDAIYKASGRQLPPEYKIGGGAAKVHGIQSTKLQDLALMINPLEAIQEEEIERTQLTVNEIKEQSSTSTNIVEKTDSLTDKKTQATTVSAEKDIQKKDGTVERIKDSKKDKKEKENIIIMDELKKEELTEKKEEEAGKTADSTTTFTPAERTIKEMTEVKEKKEEKKEEDDDGQKVKKQTY